MDRIKVAIIGSGNIGSDLMIKVMRLSQHLQMAAFHFDEIGIVFDTTSAKAHLANAELLSPIGKRLIDLTPAAIGPFVVPAVNLDQHLDARNINMVTCGGQEDLIVDVALDMLAEREAQTS